MIKNISNLQAKLQELIITQKNLPTQGHVADYIPALAEVSPKLMGISVATIDGNVIGAGDYQIPFSIQSISEISEVGLPVIDVKTTVQKLEKEIGFWEYYLG